MNNELYEICAEFSTAGLRIFPLHRIENGKCACGDPGCLATGKHPTRNNWTHSPCVDESVIESWLDGEFVKPATGFGWALDACHIVVDVDPRNGGIESLKMLESDIGFSLTDDCKAVVKTGGNGLHFYYLKPDGVDLAWKMPEKYIGIDIKQGGGFVVMPGSVHASGNSYCWLRFDKSNIDQLSYLPQSLAKMLARPSGASNNAGQSTASTEEVREALSFIDPDLPHDEWVKISIAAYRATEGAGFDVWREWCAKGAKFKPSESEARWHSFSKRVSSSITGATLFHAAMQEGYVKRDFVPEFTDEQRAYIDNFGNWGKQTESTYKERHKVTDLDDVDLYALPGKLGELQEYIRACSRYDNPNLSLAATLSVASNITGRGAYLAGRWANVTPNLLLLVIASSATGKESAMDAVRQLLAEDGIAPAIHGRIKSDKDLLDSLAQNQYATYLIDEFGGHLRKISNAQKTGNAVYLEGITYTIMEVFTKANGVLLTDISRRNAIIADLNTRRAREAAHYKDNQDQGAKARAEYLKKIIDQITHYGGMKNPVLSMFTTATPSTMADAFTAESVESGFLSRAIVFFEPEANPVPREYVPVSLPFGIQSRMQAHKFARIEDTAGRVDDLPSLVRREIVWTPEADDFMRSYETYAFEMADLLKDSGLTPLARRSAEMVAKLCLTIAAFNDSHVDMDTVRTAAKIALHDLDTKIRKVRITDGADSGEADARVDALRNKIIDICQVWASAAEIVRRASSRKIPASMVKQAIEGMISAGVLVSESTKSGIGRNRETVKYKVA